MRLRFVLICSASLLVTSVAALSSQSLPATQPNLIEIYMEDVKLGHSAEHEANEATWVAAYEKAKFPYNYLAWESITGPPRVWYGTAYESHAAIGNSFKVAADNKALTSDLARISKLDAEHLDGLRIVHARARPDLSHGQFPVLATQRFWEVTTFRLRPGFEEPFAAAAKAYGASSGRNAPKTSFRVYEVIAGMPSPTYIIFGSVAAFADLDAAMSEGDATMKGLNPAEQEAMAKLLPGVVSTETERFRLNPRMSYVPADVRNQDPNFWRPPTQ